MEKRTSTPKWRDPRSPSFEFICSCPVSSLFCFGLHIERALIAYGVTVWTSAPRYTYIFSRTTSFFFSAGGSSTRESWVAV